MWHLKVGKRLGDVMQLSVRTTLAASPYPTFGGCKEVVVFMCSCFTSQLVVAWKSRLFTFEGLEVASCCCVHVMLAGMCIMSNI